jgi:hypothetical protein
VTQKNTNLLNVQKLRPGINQWFTFYSRVPFLMQCAMLLTVSTLPMV